MSFLVSDPAPLGRAAAVVRDGRHVGDRGDLEAGGLQRPDGLLATGTRALDEDLDLAHPVLHRLLRGDVGGERGGVRRALAGTLEAGHARRAPADHRPDRVRDRDDRVVERRLDVNVPLGDVLLLLAPLLDGPLPFSHASVSSSSLRLLRGLLARADRLLRSAALPGIGLGPLATNREIPAMAKAAIRPDLLESLHVERDLSAEVALDLVAPVDELTKPVDLLLGEITHPRVRVDVRLRQDLLGRRQAEPEDVGQRNLDPLLTWDVDAGDACHSVLATPAAACAWDWCR